MAAIKFVKSYVDMVDPIGYWLSYQDPALRKRLMHFTFEIMIWVF
jgi:hypothetical protein